MRAIVAISVAFALALACAACGGGGRPTASTATIASSSMPVSALGLAPSARLSLARLPQDEDDDDGHGEEKGHDPHDSDIDGDNDHLHPKGYYDLDDAPVRDYGYAAGPSDRRALTQLVRRYYAAANADDGVAACSLLVPEYADSLPQDLGRGSAGPRFLHDATTCSQVLTVLFARLHFQFSAPIEILRVRVHQNLGLVLLGVAALPAAYVEARRVERVWRVAPMPPSSLP